MHFARGFSRRKFLARTSCSGAFYALAMRLPLPALGTDSASLLQRANIFSQGKLP